MYGKTKSEVYSRRFRFFPASLQFEFLAEFAQTLFMNSRLFAKFCTRGPIRMCLLARKAFLVSRRTNQLLCNNVHETFVNFEICEF